MRKLAIITAACLLAIGAGSQALSNAMADSQPGLAARSSPFASQAYEEQATQLMKADAQTGAIDVAAALPPARKALDASLLATEALGVLALGQDDPQQRAAILDAALAASRRGRVLNSAALVAAVESGDTEGLLATLNRTLLLYPSQKDAMIPLMVEQLANESLVPAFVQILQTEPAWGGDFLLQAATQVELAPNLARMRLALPLDSAVPYEADRAILRTLARAGLLDEAGQLFARIRSMDEVPVARGSLGWDNEYPPFQWQFFDQAGRFARLSADGQSLMVSTRAGHGGLLARRLVRLGNASTVFQVTHSLDMGSASRVRLTLQCPDSEARWSDALGPSPTMMRVDQPLDCDYAWLDIVVRAPTGSSAISGEVLDISVM